MADATGDDVAGWITEMARRMRLAPEQPDRARAGIDTLARAGIDPNMTLDQLPSADTLMQGIRGMDAPEMPPIDYAAPTPSGTQSLQTAGTAFGNPLTERLAAFGVEQGGAVGRLATDAARGLEGVGRFAGEVSGYLPAERSAHAFGEGDIAGGIGHAAQAAIPYVAGPASGPAARGVEALGRTLARPAIGIPTGTAAAVSATTAQTQAPGSQTTPPSPNVPSDAAQLRDLQQQLSEQRVSLTTLQTQRKATMDEMKAQREGTGGRAPGIGKNYSAQEAALKRLDDQITTAGNSVTQSEAAITIVRNRMTPEYQAMQQQVRDAQAVRNRITADAAKPFRDEFPTLSRTWMLAPVIAGMFVGGRAITQAFAQRGQAGRWWEAVNSARDTSLSAAERARALVRAEELERSMPVHTWRQALTHAGPLGAAATLGAGVSNVPEFYDLFTLDKVNPERRAYEEYMKLLPNNHPEVQRTINILKDMPKDNPYYEAALKHFMTIKPFIVKAAEGALEGIAGAEIMAAGGKLISPAEASLPRAETRALSRRAPDPPDGGGGGGGGGPTLHERRYDRSFRLPDAAPVAQGEVETWVSPAGNKVVTKRANGTWAEPGVRGSAEPPQQRRGWRRIATADDIMWGGYPTATG